VLEFSLIESFSPGILEKIVSQQITADIAID